MIRNPATLLLFCLCLQAAGAHGQDPGEGFGQDTGHDLPDAPRWSAEPASHSFGAISDVQVVRQDFLLSNHGPAILRIRKVAVSCDLCLTYELSNEVIRPGDVAILGITFNPIGYSGPVELSARIFTTDAEAPVQQVRMDADVVPSFRVIGGPVVFTELEKREERSWPLTLIPTAPFGAEFTAASTDYSGITAEINPVNEGQAYEITVATAGPQPREGLIHCRVRLHAGGADTPPLYAIPVTLEVVPAFHVAPQRLVLDPVDREQFRILFVRQSIDDPATVLDVRLPSDRFRAQITRDYGLPNYRINVYSRGLSGMSGEIGQIEILTDRDEPGTVQVPVQVRPAAAPQARSPEPDQQIASTGGPSCPQDKPAPQPQQIVAEILEQLGAPEGGVGALPPSVAIPVDKP